MADNKLLFKLIPKEDVEPIKDWSSLCKDPETFIKEIASRLVGQGAEISENVIVSDTIPARSNRLKLWVKTSPPYGIGQVIEGSYQVDYGMMGMPTYIPFIREKTLMDPMPASTRMISDSDAEALGLPALSGESLTRRVAYYIFEPPQIQY